MKFPTFRILCIVVSVLILLFSGVFASGGTTIYVSKKGDNTDGQSWATAFHSVQQGLLAIPDDQGGHRVVVRPDTYMEANLYPSHKGAKGAYNELIGDVDGKLGSGATGYVVLDSSAPNRGYHCFDWFSSIRAYLKDWSEAHQDETFSSAVWDRWKLRYLYASGSDAGIFFDLVRTVEPFSVVVEDCVGIGRAFGLGVANVVPREEEPCVFRRSYGMCLDWWGDAGAAYVRGHSTSTPEHPDAVFEDCTLVSPDNAIESSFSQYSGYTFVKAKNCRLIVINFSQPVGTPSTGIIHTGTSGDQFKIELEDCDLMGYKVFGCEDGKIHSVLKGRNRVYVQFQQEIPDGMEPFEGWPIELWQHLAPPPCP